MYSTTVVQSSVNSKYGPIDDALNRILKGTHTYAYGPGTIPYEIGNYTQHSALGLAPIFATDSAGVSGLPKLTHFGV